MTVSYQRQTLDTPNPLARFAHRSRLAAATTASAGVLPVGGTVLDYGCGPGDFLAGVAGARPDVSLIGYDPYQSQTFEGMRHVHDMAEVADRSVDLLTALETCEHLDDAELEELLGQAQRLLTPEGLLLISVPIVGGPGLLAKEANRMLLHRRRSEYSLAELARAVLRGKPAARAENIKWSHKGFDFRDLEDKIGREFRRLRTWVQPFPALPWYLNSQAFSLWKSTASQPRES